MKKCNSVLLLSLVKQLDEVTKITQHSQHFTSDSIDFFSKTFWTNFLSKFSSVAYLRARFIP